MWRTQYRIAQSSEADLYAAFTIPYIESRDTIDPTRAACLAVMDKGSRLISQTGICMDSRVYKNEGGSSRTEFGQFRTSQA